jgi:glycine/D-amino acid oxidase-like deaminating enzyme/nitrite reductase/ring-hydroxylating ferredoxin subunit
MALTSLWEDLRPRPEVDAPTVEGAWDVVVVGGGLTGLTTALLLGRAGLSVLVLEARRVGSGTTGRSTAKVSLLQGTHLSRMSRRQPLSVVERYVAGNREALAWLLHYAEQSGVAVQRRTAYTHATTAEGEKAARAELRAANRAGVPAQWHDRTTLPFETTGAVGLPDQAQLDPLELVDALAADVRRHGGTIVEGARVERVKGRTPVRVVTGHGEAVARTVVVATNMPVLDRGGFFARATAARSYGVALRTPEQAVDGMYLSADSPGRSLRDSPRADGGSVLLLGGNGHGTGRHPSPRQQVADLVAWADRWFPDAEVTHTWSAQDYVTASAVPYVGPLLPGQDEVLVAGGYSKWGLTNGVAAALALSGRILDGRMDWARAFDPWSGRDLRGLPSAGLMNAEVGFEMARGWIRPLGRPGTRPDPEEGAGEVRADHLGPPRAVSTVHGETRRVSAVCPHLGGVLRWNDAELSWDCPLHGSRFAPDGAVLEGPATCGLKALDQPAD